MVSLEPGAPVCAMSPGNKDAVIAKKIIGSGTRRIAEGKV
jgi:hypothetical protein